MKIIKFDQTRLKSVKLDKLGPSLTKLGLSKKKMKKKHADVEMVGLESPNPWFLYLLISNQWLSL